MPRKTTPTPGWGNPPVVLFSLILITAFDWPRYVIEVFGLPLPLLGGNPPYLMPILLLFVAFSAWASAKELCTESPLQRGDGLFLLSMAIWLWLELANSLESGRFHSEMLLTNIWCFVVLVALRIHSRRFDLRLQAPEIFVSLLVAWSLAHMFFYLCARHGIPPLARMIDLGDLIGRNAFSHLNCLAILLLLFDLPRFGPIRRYLIYLPILGGVLATNGSRGATMIAAILVFWRIARIVKKFSGIVQIGALLALLALAALASDRILPVVNRMTVGIDFAPQVEVQTLAAQGDDHYSAYARNKSNMLVIESFIENPFYGVGAYALTQIRAARYQSHTYWLYPLGAYGLFGTLPYVLWYIVMWRRRRHLQHELSWPLAFFVVATMTFTNDMYSWYAVVFFLVTQTSSDAALSDMLVHTRERALQARFQWIRGNS